MSIVPMERQKKKQKVTKRAKNTVKARDYVEYVKIGIAS